MKVKRDFIYDPSLVLYLPLYELDGSSFMSKDAYGHLCTVTGAVWRPDGRLFDGADDYIDCGTGSSLDLWTSSITLIIWYYPTAGGWQYLLSRNYKYAIGFTDAELPRAYFTDSGGAARIAQSGDALSLNNWYHLAAVYDRDDVAAGTKIFVDGVSKATGATNGDLQSTAESLYVGVSSQALGDDVNGKIGEVRVYSRALTPLEIQHNYLATKWRYR